MFETDGLALIGTLKNNTNGLRINYKLHTESTFYYALPTKNRNYRNQRNHTYNTFRIEITIMAI